MYPYSLGMSTVMCLVCPLTAPWPREYYELTVYQPMHTRGLKCRLHEFAQTGITTDLSSHHDVHASLLIT